jgi:hypothetical protein
MSLDGNSSGCFGKWGAFLPASPTGSITFAVCDARQNDRLGLSI